MRIIINQIPEGFTRLVLSSCYKWRRQCRGWEPQRYRVFQKTFNQILAYWQPSEDHTFRSSPFSAQQCWWRSLSRPFLNRHARLYNKPVLFLSLFLAFVRISSPSHHRAYFVLTSSFFINTYIYPPLQTSRIVRSSWISYKSSCRRMRQTRALVDTYRGAVSLSGLNACSCHTSLTEF